MRQLRLLLPIASLLILLAACEENDPTANNSEPITLSCSINSSITLTNHNLKGVDYIINCPVDVVGGTFKIDTAVTIQFTSGGSLTIWNDAYIQAIGMENKPIIFEGTSNTKGSWGYVQIASPDNRNEMKYCVLRNGGNDTFATGAAEFTYETNPILFVDGRLSLDHCTIENSEQDGAFFAGSSVIRGLSNTSFIGNSRFPISLYGGNMENTSFGTCTFSGNGNNYIGLFSKTSNAVVEENAVFNKASVPYYPITEMNFEENLTINAGVTFVMKSASLMSKGGNGFIKINGTSAEPVTIRGESNSAGFWRGLLVNTDNTENKFFYLNISNGGNSPTAFTDVKANISVGSVRKARLEINNVTSTLFDGCAIAVSIADGTLINNTGISVPVECTY